MKRFLFYILSLVILITCTKDAFEQDTEAPTVFFSVEASASQGGSVDTPGGSIESGSTITITATPELEYIFTGWTGISSTENPLTITVNNNLTITANFEKRKYPLTINIEGEGTVKEEIVSTGKSTDYDSGSVVKLTAVPSDGYALMRWNNNGVLDTLNPIQITIDSNKAVDVNFDYQTARDIVGTWEFDLQDSETAKSQGKILMRISIELDILFTMILNNVTTQIFTKLNTLNSSTLVMGDFGVLTNVNFNSPTSLNFNVVTLPPDSNPPSTAGDVPSATSSNSINLSGGNKISSSSAPFVPPLTAVTSATATDQINPAQALSSIISQTAPFLPTLSGLSSSTTASSCTISGTLTSGPPSQTVSISTAITNVVGTFNYTCSDTLSISVSGLPPGVSMSSSGNVATISGTPTGSSSGTYNYTVTAVNSTGIASASYSGDITVSLSASTTLVPCSGTISLTSGPSTQTVSASTAITSVNYLVSTNCTDTTTVSASGLPPGVTMNYTSSSGAVVVSGTPSGAASGTYNYSILAMFAPTSDATASATISGAISIAASSSTTLVPCSGTISLTSGPSTQTVSASTAITSVNYLVSTNCTDTTTVSASGLPPGVTMNYTSSSGAVVVSGTPSGAASGTYNYSILAMFAPTSDATASATISGAISISAPASSTTASFSLDVTAPSSSDYNLVGNDRNGSISGNDPDITFNVGDTINFVVDASGHPFYLKTTAGTGTGNTISGVTSNGAEIGTITWTPSSTGTYYYQCSLHSGMVGTITIQ